MLRTSVIVPLILSALGFCLISGGGDAEKTADIGIRYAPIRIIATILGLSYQFAAILMIVFGVGHVVLAAAICRRVDRGAAAATPAVKPPASFMLALFPGVVVGVLLWALIDPWPRA